MSELPCKLTPNARRNEILGWDRDTAGRPFLKIKLAAPPVEGKANRALIAFLAETLEIPRGSITFLQGEQSRLKRLRIEGLSAGEIADRLGLRPP